MLDRPALLDCLNVVPGIRLPADPVSKRQGNQLVGFGPETTTILQGVMVWFVDELRTGGLGQGATSASASPH